MWRGQSSVIQSHPKDSEHTESFLFTLFTAQCRSHAVTYKAGFSLKVSIFSVSIYLSIYLSIYISIYLSIYHQQLKDLTFFHLKAFFKQYINFILITVFLRLFWCITQFGWQLLYWNAEGCASYVCHISFQKYTFTHYCKWDIDWKRLFQNVWIIEDMVDLPIFATESVGNRK